MTLTLAIWPLVKVLIRLCDILSRPTLQWGVMYQTRFALLGMWTLWPWPWRYDLRLRSYHNLVSRITIVWNIIQIQLDSGELLPGHGFWVCVHCDIDIRHMTFSQGQDNLVSWAISVSKIIQILLCIEGFWPGHRCLVYMHCGLRDMTLGQGHDTPFRHGQ